jgi:Ser/Thr protein kinase RdoA (MazF antagonist)
LSPTDTNKQDQQASPSFFEPIVRDMLTRFGVDPTTHLEPFPCGPSDLLARFEHEGIPHLLKGRAVEQRGQRSLFETQRLQQILLSEGLSVPALLTAPSGETLIQGPNWEGEAAKQLQFYEIQRQVAGTHFSPTLDNLRRAGDLVARFHQIGAEIDTYLLNKMAYISVFRQRGLKSRRQFYHQLCAAIKDTDERHKVEAFYQRLQDPALQVYFDWRPVHGDLTCENLLDDGNHLYLIDWDEIGLHAKTADHGDVLGSLDDADATAVHALIDGYLDAGGQLEAPDLESIHNSLVGTALRRWLKRADGSSIEPLFARYKFLLG